MIVNWNGASSLVRALPSIYQSTQSVSSRVEILVIDNGSTDDSLAVLCDEPRVRLIENHQNLGFAAAVNQGIRASAAPFIAFLNNDVVCDPMWLRELYLAIEREPGLGSVGAQLRYLDEPDRINSAGIVVDLLGRAHDRHDGVSVSSGDRTVTEVFGVSAGAALFRRSMLESIGFLDERFFAYYEDVDLAWRAQRAGWRSALVPTATVLHEHSATSRRIPGLKCRLSSRNALWTLLKNAAPRHLAVALPAQIMLACWTAALALVRRDHSAVVGLIDAARNARPIVQDRQPPFLPLRCFPRPTLFVFRKADRTRPGR